MSNVEIVKASSEYDAIRRFYGDHRAHRSQVPLINHILDGLVVLNWIGATRGAMRAYCIHPLFQNDSELMGIGTAVTQEGVIKDAYVVMLAMEYRARANAWLSDKVQTIRGSDRLRLHGAPHPGTLLEVRDMLVADKVQNYKDFLRYHKETHPRSACLDRYFNTWLTALDVTPEVFRSLCAAIDERRA